jgi:hypothetical protein
MEIINLAFLLPILVTYKHNNKEDTVMAYADQITQRIIVPEDVDNLQEFKIMVKEYLNKHRRTSRVPSIPKEGFETLKPDIGDI